MINISLIVIKTNQLEKQADFYSRLGFQFDYHNHGNGPFHFASVGSPVVLEIYPLPKRIAAADNTTRLGFQVHSLDELIRNLQADGVTIVSFPAHSDWGYTAVVQDYDGRKIELSEK
ncbi:VOC family protein [Chitinophaga caseinilytica]|uniref:VOC family protein n=1 Tax=Chitinophaga caseinilytica TaxID=2267521 RepID=UPI003C2C0980